MSKLNLIKTNSIAYIDKISKPKLIKQNSIGRKRVSIEYPLGI